jgi:dsRNA-specific ribonuclease
MKTDTTSKDNSIQKVVMEALSIITFECPIEDYKRELSAWFSAYLANNEYSDVAETRADSFQTYEVLIEFLDRLKVIEGTELNQKILEAGVFNN